MAEDENLRKVRTIVEQELDLEDENITESASFVDDYDADSMSLIQVLARIERELGVKVPPDEYEEMRSLGAVYEVVARHAGWETNRV
jgi:acyl carrier protein